MDFLYDISGNLISEQGQTMTEYVYLDGMPVIKISGGQEPSAAMCWDMESSGSCITGLWAKGSMGYDNTQIYQDSTHVKSGTYAEKMHVDTGYTGRILTGWLGITKSQIETTHRYLDFWIYSSAANNVKAYAEVKYDSTCGTSEHVTIFDSTNAVAGWNHVNVDLLAAEETSNKKTTENSVLIKLLCPLWLLSFF